MAASDLYLDLGGRSLHVVESGQGSPAVILEAGSGCSSEHWRAVQELTGESAATYSYDRAGHGSSDPGDPWTLDGWVADLEAWLAAALVPPPYLLVGHSLGGHIVRTFAARHPADVMGMILVDARHENLMPGMPETFRKRAAELLGYDYRCSNEADETVRNLPVTPNLPVSVITHSRADWIHEVFGLDQAELAQAERAWQKYQLDLVAKFPGSRFVTAAGSGHMIPVEEPELVADEIRRMLAQGA